ncbi:MAG: TldD/PmbA family protein [Coriobacteriia bacterium]|nr:TldD/PmbA family protein [Coriobacteriia bacterium]
MLSAKDALELAAHAIAFTPADEAEALVSAEQNALTRFANNRINQNVAEQNVTLSVRAIVGRRVGVAGTDRMDERSIKACCDAAVAAARMAPEDPAFPGLPQATAAGAARPSDRAHAGGRGFDAETRAEAVAAMVDAARSHGLTAAGKVRSAVNVLAVANSQGIGAAGAISGIQATVLAAGAGTGWASFLGRDASGFDPAALGIQAADLAIRSANPGTLDAGTYPVVLAPEAVADILDFLAYTGFSAKAYAEERSFMSKHVGDELMSPLVTIFDDAPAPHALGMTFDYEGVPKKRVVLIENGVVRTPVTDSYWAVRTNTENTGHALPAPNQFGPMPLDLEMAAGDATGEELVARVKRGVYVTRFHYVNVEDPIRVTITGMTRDGTFLIEDGRLTRPLKNLRFTQSAIDALRSCTGVSSTRQFVGTEESATLVPTILCEEFAITGQTR